MQCLTWSPESNSVYVPEIDEDHRTIFRMADELYQAMVAGALLSAVEPVLRELIGHVDRHFSREERMMRSTRYHAYAWHKGQHDVVRAKAVELVQVTERGDRDAVLPILDYLTAWLQTHTAVSDRMMGAYLRNNSPDHRVKVARPARIATTVAR